MIPRPLFVVLMILALPVAAAQAQDDQYAEIRDIIESCDECHGKNGASTDDAFPIIGGQQLHYTYVQLKDFKARRRDHEIMSPIAAELEKNQMLLLAQYYSEQTWPDIGYRANPSEVVKGRKAGNAGQCVACHLSDYKGNSRNPRLAGQHPAYLDKTMQHFKIKARNNAAAMTSLMNVFSDDDISAMAEFLGNL